MPTLRSSAAMCQLPQEVIHLTPIDGTRRVPFDHGRPAATLQFEPSLVGEHSIGERHRVEVNPEIERQLTNRRQQVAGLEPLFHQMASQIIGDLPIGGNRRLEVERHAECAAIV